MLILGNILLSLLVIATLIISIAAYLKAKLNEKRVMTLHEYNQKKTGLK